MQVMMKKFFRGRERTAEHQQVGKNYFFESKVGHWGWGAIKPPLKLKHNIAHEGARAQRLHDAFLSRSWWKMSWKRPGMVTESPKRVGCVKDGLVVNSPASCACPQPRAGRHTRGRLKKN